MASRVEFKNLLTSQATIWEMALDEYGVETLTQTHGVFPCHLDQHSKVIFGAQKDERKWADVFFFADDAPFDAEKRWQVVFNSRVRRVLQIDVVRDPRDGNIHHYEVAVE